jgi:hypothetical protein
MRKHAKKLGLALIALFPVIASAQEAAPASEQEYESLLRQASSLRAYNQLMQRQIASQNQDLENLQSAIEQVPDLERNLPPLILRMVDGLDAFVKRDMPFLNEERATRVRNLYELLDDPKVNDTVKLRRVLEAWSIEVEYGGAFRTYRETSEEYLPAGLPPEVADRELDFIALGRVGLLFQTNDEDAITGAWDYRDRSWVILDSRYRNAVGQALRMARNQIAPELLLLPTVPPQPQDQ